MKGIIVASALLLSACASQPTTTERDLQENKDLVVTFYEQVIFGRDASAIDKYIGDTYTQHNPMVPDGKEALRSFIGGLPPKKPGDPPSGEIVRVVAEDDLVVLHVHNYARPQPRGSAIVDIFRVEDGKITEHWDVIQPIPEKSANDNTMF